MSQAISTSSTRLLNFNYDFANCCVTIATMTIKQDLRTCTNKFLNYTRRHLCKRFREGIENVTDSVTTMTLHTPREAKW